MKIWARGSNICDKNQEWDRGMLSQAKIAICSKIYRNLEFQYHKLKTRLQKIYIFSKLFHRNTQILILLQLLLLIFKLLFLNLLLIFYWNLFSQSFIIIIKRGLVFKWLNRKTKLILKGEFSDNFENYGHAVYFVVVCSVCCILVELLSCSIYCIIQPFEFCFITSIASHPHRFFHRIFNRSGSVFFGDSPFAPSWFRILQGALWTSALSADLDPPPVCRAWLVPLGDITTFHWSSRVGWVHPCDSRESAIEALCRLASCWFPWLLVPWALLSWCTQRHSSTSSWINESRVYSQ